MTSPLPIGSLLTLEQVQQAGPLDRSLLTVARQHVGAAGLAQSAALERLIAAGQEHAGLIAALRALAQLVEQDSDGRELYRASLEQLEVLKHLESLVAAALRQITATPVEAVSASVLESIAAGTKRHVTALEGLLSDALGTGDQSADRAARLADIRTTIQEQFMSIARLEAVGQLRAFELLGGELIGHVTSTPLASAEERALVLETLGRSIARTVQALRKHPDGTASP